MGQILHKSEYEKQSLKRAIFSYINTDTYSIYNISKYKNINLNKLNIHKLRTLLKSIEHDIKTQIIMNN